MSRSPWGWVALLGAAATLAWVPFGGRALSPDEGGLLILAGQWSPGSSLYGDYFVDRPPMLIALFALADQVGDAWALRTLGVLAAVLAVVLAGALGRLAAPTTRMAPVLPAATVAILVATPLFGSTVVNGELLGLPFLLAGIAATVAAYRAHRPAAVLGWALLAGAAGAAGAMVKQSLLDVFVVALVLAITQARDRGTGTTVRVLGGGFAGSLVTTAATVAVAARRGTDPVDLWHAVVAFRGQAASVIAQSATGTTSDRLGGLLVALVVSGAPLIAVALLRTLRRGVPRPPLDLRLPAYALLAWESVVVLSGGSYWLHYLMGLIPGLALLAAAAVQRVLVSRRLLQVAYGVAAASTVVTLVWVAVEPIDRPEAPVVAYLDEHARPGDTAVVAFGGANILQATDLRSPYPDLWSLPVRVHDPDLDAAVEHPCQPRPTDLADRGRHLARHLGHRCDHGRHLSPRPLHTGDDRRGLHDLPEQRTVTVLSDPPTTSRPARTRAMAAYSLLLLVWSWFVGIPNDPAGVVLWIWFGTVAWDIEAPPRSHLEFWRDWWKPLLLMVVYWLGPRSGGRDRARAALLDADPGRRVAGRRRRAHGARSRGRGAATRA